MSNSENPTSVNDVETVLHPENLEIEKNDSLTEPSREIDEIQLTVDQQKSTTNETGDDRVDLQENTADKLTEQQLEPQHVDKLSEDPSPSSDGEPPSDKTDDSNEDQSLNTTENNMESTSAIEDQLVNNQVANAQDTTSVATTATENTSEESLLSAEKQVDPTETDSTKNMSETAETPQANEETISPTDVQKESETIVGNPESIRKASLTEHEVTVEATTTENSEPTQKVLPTESEVIAEEAPVEAATAENPEPTQKVLPIEPDTIVATTTTDDLESAQTALPTESGGTIENVATVTTKTETAPTAENATTTVVKSNLIATNLPVSQPSTPVSPQPKVGFFTRIRQFFRRKSSTTSSLPPKPTNQNGNPPADSTPDTSQLLDNANKSDAPPTFSATQ